MKKEERISGFVDAIWTWYAVHKRELPWRDMPISDENERAYRVLVSEVMLQQTQVSRVKIVFRNFLEQFPSLADLASASNAEIIMAWRGMGYNSRALRLRDAARYIVEKFQVRKFQVSNTRNLKPETCELSDPAFVFPKEMNELLAIPGIGPYTASAIRNFAFNIPTPCIDTNIRRILHRTFVGPENADGTWTMGDKELLKIADEILLVAVGNDENRNPNVETNSNDSMSKNQKNVLCFDIRSSDFRCDAANWHAALMDYGSLVQTKNNPKWDLCILTDRKLMKTTPGKWQTNKPENQKTIRQKQEPGRYVGSRYIPNRIFRGKIVEALRNEQSGLALQELGSIVCIDWEDQHRAWLQSLITKLIQDRLISEKKGRFVLAD